MSWPRRGDREKRPIEGHGFGNRKTGCRRHILTLCLAAFRLTSHGKACQLNVCARTRRRAPDNLMVDLSQSGPDRVGNQFPGALLMLPTPDRTMHMTDQSDPSAMLRCSGLGPISDYWVDAFQRSVLFLDVLRQRGNIAREHNAAGPRMCCTTRPRCWWTAVRSTAR